MIVSVEKPHKSLKDTNANNNAHISIVQSYNWKVFGHALESSTNEDN